jgi:adenosylcobinamide-phosphate synthase
MGAWVVAALPRPGAVACGLVLDRLLGEPPASLHPVVAFGTAMSALERRIYTPCRTAGVAHASIGLGIALATASALDSPALATALAVAGRSLRETAGAIATELEAGELGRARSLLPCLVGRDVSGLGLFEMSRAVVESVAENTVDAVVAPALWGAVAGARGALGYRASNTLDSMVGHHSDRYERYGWASARLDDVASYLPARLTAALVVLVRPSAWRQVLAAVRLQAPGHPSPNAGVAEAAFAAALGLRLGGLNRYGNRSELRPSLGTGRPPEPGDIAAAIRLCDDVEAALTAALAVIAAAVVVCRRHGQRRGDRRLASRRSRRGTEPTGTTRSTWLAVAKDA